MSGPMWTEVVEYVPPPRNFEEQVERRRRSKCLLDCELPEGFRLVTERPRQFWLGQQMVWGFKLAWGPVNQRGERGEDRYTFVSRYEVQIGDEPQLRWAVDEFSAELVAAGERLERTSSARKVVSWPMGRVA